MSKAASPAQVLVVCTELSRRRLGGPGVMMELLLKQHENAGANGFSMVTVFREKHFHTYAQLEAEAKASVVDRFRPASLGYWANAALGRLGFLWNVRSAMRGDHSGRVIHCHDFVSSYLAQLFFRGRYPIIQTIHAKGGAVREIVAENSGLEGSFWEKVAKHVEWTSIRKADVVVFTSRGSRELFRKEHPGLLDGKDERIIHAGVDLDELDAIPDDPAIAARYGIPADAFLLLTVAALVPDKGLDTLVEAIAALPAEIRGRVRALVIGRDGPLREKLESLIAERGLKDNVRLIGFVDRQDLVQLMRRAALFALTPSISVFDHVLMEVGALGTPIVTTAVGGNLEMFDADSALMVPPEDPGALADAIARALEDEGLRQRVGEAARTRVRTRFSLDALLNAYEDLYAEVRDTHEARRAGVTDL